MAALLKINLKLRTHLQIYRLITQWVKITTGKLSIMSNIAKTCFTDVRLRLRVYRLRPVSFHCYKQIDDTAYHRANQSL